MAALICSANGLHWMISDRLYADTRDAETVLFAGAISARCLKNSILVRYSIAPDGIERVTSTGAAAAGRKGLPGTLCCTGREARRASFAGGRGSAISKDPGQDVLDGRARLRDHGLRPLPMAEAFFLNGSNQR